MGADIIIEYDGVEDMYFTYSSLQEAKDRFEQMKREIKELNTHIVRETPNLIETYDRNTNKVRTYYISLS